MKPALDRALRRFGIPPQDWKSFEERVLREGQRNLHRYLTDLPDRNDWAEWFALLQHHGAPTRLLDWSYSFFVALFFAIDKADPCLEGSGPKPAKIFAIDNEELVDLRKKEYEVGLPQKIRDLHNTNEKDPCVLTYFLKETADLDIVLPLNPFRLNERLAIEQGIFLFCPNRAKSFDEVYKKMRENHPGLAYEIVIHISPSLVAQILTYLGSQRNKQSVVPRNRWILSRFRAQSSGRQELDVSPLSAWASVVRGSCIVWFRSDVTLHPHFCHPIVNFIEE